MKNFLLSALIVLASVEAFAQKQTTEWQWSTLVRNAVENKGLSRAFLWIPPNCTRIRGVVVAQNNMEEISILANPIFRKNLSEIGFAEVWCTPFFDPLFRFNQGADVAFNGMMDDLAELSGYAELKYIPVVPIGHSAAASWPYYFAAWNPERTLAAISVSGQWPYFRNDQFAPDIWGDRNIDSIPCIETMGEYEAANTWSTEGLQERQQHPLMPLSMLACPAEGHFASSDKKAAYLSFYIRKAIEYRFPKEEKEGSPLKLIPIDPSKTGWLADKWRLGKAPVAEPAPVGSYKGDSLEAFWFFDEEMVQATEEYQKAYCNFKPQLVGYIQNGQLIPQQNTHLQVHPAFQPLEDGLTFHLSGAFYDTVPAVSSRLTDWTKLPVGSPIGHASGKTPVSIDRIAGPFIKVNANTFRVSFDRAYTTKDNRVELVFKATHPGDGAFKPAVQQASMTIPLRNTEGTEQRIDFKKIQNKKEGIRSLKLLAASDSKLPVQFYVLEGPAEIEGNTLVFTKIPPRSKFPVKVTVVAWQYGRSSLPKVKSAEPVTQCFYLTRSNPIHLDSIKPGEVWPDADGNHIQAHGGGIIKIKDTYFWYGEQRGKGLDPAYRYVSCYGSKDLMNWKFRGNVVKMLPPDSLASNWILERPKVFYNAKTKKYVMYFHLDDAKYQIAQVGIAVCDKPDGAFKYVKRFRPLGHESRDIGQFIDDDGTAYLVFEDRPFGFRIARLSEDYMGVEKEMTLVKAHMEGGAIVHYKGLYYSIGSELTGWNANPNKYSTAPTLEGPWTNFQDVAPQETNTYGSQSTMLIKVVGSKNTTVIFMGDKWNPKNQWNSRYLWMPLEIGDGKLWLPKPQPWKLNIKTGEATVLH